MKRFSPQHDRAARPSRRKRVFRIALAALAVLLVARFFGLRSTDRTAWPAPAPGVRLEPLPAAADVPLATAERCREIAGALPPATNAPVRALRVLQALGYAALSDGEREELDARWGGNGSRRGPWEEYGDLVINAHGFAPDPDGAAAHAAFVSRFAEFAIGVAGGLERRSLENGFGSSKWAGHLGDYIRFFFHGAGLLGRTACLNGVTVVCRGVSMGSVEWTADFDEASGRNSIGKLRLAESNIVSCAEALREDRVSILAAVHAIYTGEGGAHLSAAAGGAAPKGLHGFGGWFVRRLGGTEEATRAHLDALFSRLIANAENPYTPDGLVAGLPDWCRLKGRTPWTRDPVGAAIAGAYLRHAVVAAAVEPTLRLELRAVRIAIALRLWKDAHGGAYPETLDELASGERPLLAPADFADPFAPGAAPLRYARDGEGWRFWSVGLDGRDGGGARDAFTAPPDADLAEADLVFTSRERDIRRAALDAAQRR
ncbi:MAG: hypothetical protein IJV65_02910 [Kiritimatiellae bacterium]|nr:hypothetical protein [Kiritimatiellia bacterium]